MNNTNNKFEIGENLSFVLVMIIIVLGILAAALIENKL